MDMVDTLDYDLTLKELNIENEMNDLIKHIMELNTEVDNNNILDMAILDLVVMDIIDVLVTMKFTSFGDVSYSKTLNQLTNRIKNEYSIMLLLNNLIECLIYQRQKTYKGDRTINKYLRTDFKQLILFGLAKEIGNKILENN